MTESDVIDVPELHELEEQGTRGRDFRNQPHAPAFASERLAAQGLPSFIGALPRPLAFLLPQFDFWVSERGWRAAPSHPVAHFRAGPDVPRLLRQGVTRCVHSRRAQLAVRLVGRPPAGRQRRHVR